VFFSSLVNPTGKRTEDAAGFEEAWRRQFGLIRDNAATRGVTKAPFQNRPRFCQGCEDLLSLRNNPRSGSRLIFQGNESVAELVGLAL
jgi:hypothetical protein